MAGGLDQLPQQLPPPSIPTPVNPHLLTVGWPSDLLLIKGIWENFVEGGKCGKACLHPNVRAQSLRTN